MLKALLIAAAVGCATVCLADPAPHTGGSAGTSGPRPPAPVSAPGVERGPSNPVPATAPPVHDLQPSIVPITLSPNDISQIISYLQARPYQEAAPLMTFFSQKEAEAQAAAHKKSP